MAENTTTPAPGGETPNGTAPIQGETPITPGTGETPGTTTELSPADIRKENERLAAALKRANAEAKEYRLAKEELDKIKTAQMTEQERKDKQLADLQKAYDEHVQSTFERLVSAEIRAQAASFGINPKHLDKVARFIEWEDISPDEQGNPTGIKEAIKKLIEDMPELRPGKATAPAPTGGGATAPARSQVENGEVTASYVADIMSGKIPWQSLTQDRRTAVLQWQAKNPYRF